MAYSTATQKVTKTTLGDPPTSTNITHYNIIAYLAGGGIVPPTPVFVSLYLPTTPSTCQRRAPQLGHNDLQINVPRDVSGGLAQTMNELDAGTSSMVAFLRYFAGCRCRKAREAIA